MLALPERAVQFGTGAFLRGFVDYFLDVANASQQFNGRVVAIGSTGSGRERAFTDQDGLYTLVSRGITRGASSDERPRRMHRDARDKTILRTGKIRHTGGTVVDDEMFA